MAIGYAKPFVQLAIRRKRNDLLNHTRYSLPGSTISILFPQDNTVVPEFVRMIGLELIFGRLFGEIGFDVIPERLLRDIIIALFVNPSSKLKTLDSLNRYQGKAKLPVSIHLFLGCLNDHCRLMLVSADKIGFN